MNQPEGSLATNRRAFGRPLEGHALLRLYGILVACELAAKDYRRRYGLAAVPGSAGHDFSALFLDTPWETDRSCEMAKIDLEGKLRRIRCLTVTGTPGTVRPRAYPDLRYARLNGDFLEEATSPDELEDALVAAGELMTSMDKRLLELTFQRVIP